MLDDVVDETWHTLENIFWMCMFFELHHGFFAVRPNILVQLTNVTSSPNMFSSPILGICKCEQPACSRNSFYFWPALHWEETNVYLSKFKTHLQDACHQATFPISFTIWCQKILKIPAQPRRKCKAFGEYIDRHRKPKMRWVADRQP